MAVTSLVHLPYSETSATARYFSIRTQLLRNHISSALRAHSSATSGRRSSKS